MAESTTAASSVIERFSIGSVELPIRYTDGSALACIYRVDLADARAVMASECFEPLPVGGKAMAQLMALEYRETSVGPYNELGVLVLARRTGSAPSAVRSLVKPASVEDAGWYVVNLPVTTGFCAPSVTRPWMVSGARAGAAWASSDGATSRATSAAARRRRRWSRIRLGA